jgi:Domain of unknown function (DUF4386)
MMSDRSISRTTGVLFILASAAAIVGGSLDVPATDGTALEKVSRGQVVTGALIEVVLALSVVAIAFTVYPILRRVDPGLALGYVAIRTLEAALVLVAVLSVLVVVAPEAAPAVVADPRHVVLVDVREWGYRLGTIMVFGVSAIVLNGLLIRGRLVPAWLAWWGLLGGVLLLLRGVLEMYDVSMSVAVQGLMAAPIGLQEMVLAVWLIVRGFAHVRTRADASAAQV